MTENRSSDQVRENLKRIRFEIEETCSACGRDPNDVTLMAVTKTVSPELVNVALSEGVRLLGENRAQELVSKYEFYHTDFKQIHFIGHLQTNKVKQIIDKVSMIESVDSEHLAAEINRCAGLSGKTMEILLEVNLGGEQSKSGVAKEDLFELAEKVSRYPNLILRGLMVIPPVGEGARYFEQAQKLLIDMQAKKLDNRNVNILSMGMSADYIDAIRFGGTIIRVGRGLFGERN